MKKINVDGKDVFESYFPNSPENQTDFQFDKKKRRGSQVIDVKKLDSVVLERESEQDETPYLENNGGVKDASFKQWKMKLQMHDPRAYKDTKITQSKIIFDSDT